MVNGRVIAGALALLAVACGEGNRYVPPPPAEVTVAQPVRREVTTWGEFTGNTAAVESVDLRARVQGFLQQINFQPGSVVKEGELLFVIEPDPYRARLQAAEADVAGQEAQYQAAQAQLEITEAIFKRDAGSKTDLVEKQQARDLARAALETGRATLEQAKINYSYTHIHAPITGRIDRNLVDRGNLVGAGEATLLATIVREDPIYAYFDVSERALLEYRALQRQGQTVAEEGTRNKAYMALLTDHGFPHVGELDFADNRVDPSSGTMELRAIFANPAHTIVPGLFVRVRLPRTRGPALLVPAAAVGQDLGGHFVLVVDDTNTVQYRRVALGDATEDQLRVVQDGVGPDDWLIVNGLQRARPGATVKPLRQGAAAADGAAPASASAPPPPA